jgi:HTH-type transcriptional regulator/antitoxin HipB
MGYNNKTMLKEYIDITPLRSLCLPMNYATNTPTQLRAVLRGLRKARGLSQTEVGRLLGVSQKRIARIEAAPNRTAYEQIAKLIALLGGRIVVEETLAPQPPAPTATAGDW